ncbi:hypothetical protein OWS73_04060 [Burkholderia sp. 1B3(2022)]|uniref:hypothetical protein n=1 Tax=Burkholderia sp. 1B3(2022) TaxID=2997425 RepID=UPI002FCCA3A9
MDETKESRSATPSNVYFGPSAQRKWLRRGAPRDVDVVLLTHPRDRADVERMFPWAGMLDGDALADLLDCLQPVYGEIIEAKGINIGILFCRFSRKTCSIRESVHRVAVAWRRRG